MKILFTHSYFLEFDPKQKSNKKPYPPLGTLWAAAVLRENGHDVSLFDTNFAQRPEEIIPVLEREKPDVLVIYDDGFNYLTKMCLTNMREAAFKMTEIADERGIKTIISSSDASDHYDKYLEHKAEQVIIGEGEMSLLDLISGKDLSSIKGIAYKENGKSIRTENRQVIKDLDKIPFPAWDLIDFQTYKKVWQAHGYFSINMASSRGCPYQCSWCAKPIYGRHYVSRSPENLIEEIKQIHGEFGFQHIWFCDDIFGLESSWLKSFNNQLKKEGIRIRYTIQSRADLLLKEDNVRYLSESGCDEIWIGVESGSQKILDAMNKGTKVDDIFKASSLLKKHKIKPSFFLQFGYLGEEMDDIQKTLDMLFELMPNDIGVSVSYPLPGTPFYETVKNQLQEKANWTDSDELLVMYKTTYSPEFYKALHRYIHKRFRANQALKANIDILLFRAFRFKKALSLAYFIPASMQAKSRMKKLSKNKNYGETSKPCHTIV